MIKALDTYDRQRNYLVDNGISAQLSRVTLDRIAGSIDFNTFRSLEVAMVECDKDLQLLPNDEDILSKRGKYLARKQSLLQEVQRILDEEARRSTELGQKQKDNQQAILDMKEALKAFLKPYTEIANKNRSEAMAQLVNSLKSTAGIK